MKFRPVPWRGLLSCLVLVLAVLAMLFSMPDTAAASSQPPVPSIRCSETPPRAPEPGRPLPEGTFTVPQGYGLCTLADLFTALGYYVEPGVPVTADYLFGVNKDRIRHPRKWLNKDQELLFRPPAPPTPPPTPPRGGHDPDESTGRPSPPSSQPTSPPPGTTTAPTSPIGKPSQGQPSAGPMASPIVWIASVALLVAGLILWIAWRRRTARSDSWLAATIKALRGAGVPPNVLAAGRHIGIPHGTNLFVLGFLGLMITRVAADLHTTGGVVTIASFVAAVVGVALAVEEIITRLGVPREWVTIATFAVGAAGLLAVGLAPHIAFVYAGLVVATVPRRVLSPIRPALSDRLRPAGHDGTFTSRVRLWSYLTFAVLTVVVAAITGFHPEGWRFATVAFAAWLACCGVVLGRWLEREYPSLRDEHKPIPVWELWDRVRGGELWRNLIAAVCAVAVGQLVWYSLEPYLSGLGLAGSAVLVIGGLEAMRLLSIPWIVRYGTLSNVRARRAAALTALWLFGSALIAIPTTQLVGLPELPLALALPLIVLSGVVLQVGSGALNDATRTSMSRRGIEGGSLASLAQAFGYAIGTLFAALGSWPVTVAVWAVMALAAVAITRRREPGSTEYLAKAVESTAKVMSVRLTAVPGSQATARMFVYLGERQIGRYLEVGEDDLIVVETPEDTSRPDSALVPVWRSRVTPPMRRSPPRKSSGRLFAARIPLVLDGDVFARARWRPTKGGRWQVTADGRHLEITSEYLTRSLTIRVERHNA